MHTPRLRIDFDAPNLRMLFVENDALLSPAKKQLGPSARKAGDPGLIRYAADSASMAAI